MERLIDNTKKGAFGHLLTGALSKYINEQLEQPPDDQNDLQQELALVRASAMVAIEKFNEAMETGDKGAAFLAGKVMKQDLNEVASMASAAARVQATRSDQMTKAAVENILGGVIDIIFNALRGEERGLEIAANIEKQIYNRINISADRGTVSQPSDEVVRLMDNSIGRDSNTVDAEATHLG